MMRHVIPEVEALWADERGALLGLSGAPDFGAARAAAERFAEPAHGRCRAALDALAALPEADRRAELAALAGGVGAAVPEGLEHVHPGWVRRALEGESSLVVRIVMRDLPATAAAPAAELLRARGDTVPGLAAPAVAETAEVVALRRRVLAGLAPMPSPREAGATLDEVDRRGAETLGRALAGAPPDVVARAAAGVGEPWAPAVLEATRTASAEERTAARELVAAVPPGEAARGVARAVGLRAVARDLARESPAGRAAAAQRLPPAVGDALLALADAAGGEER
jgi:hypothetical protein